MHFRFWVLGKRIAALYLPDLRNEAAIFSDNSFEKIQNEKELTNEGNARIIKTIKYIKPLKRR